MICTLPLIVLLVLPQLASAVRCSAADLQQLLGDYSDICSHHFAPAVLLTAQLADLHVLFNRSLATLHGVSPN